MQIVEVKNDTAKIIFNPAENNLLPYDFILIEDNNYKLISQVISIESGDNSENNTAVLKLSLFIDENETLSYYNGYVPSKNAKTICIDADEIISLLKDKNENIDFGKLSNHPNCSVCAGLSLLDKKLYIQSDKNEKIKFAVYKIASELSKLNKNVVILDFNKSYSDLDGCVIRISEDLKLPLNTDAFDTILKYDIQDCPIEDKALIQSIILELREYLKTLDDKFIPFNLFKKVVDNEFMANPISGLMLLRNKLWYYAQEAIFADLKKQFDFIEKQLETQNVIIIDASEMSEIWYEFILKTVSELINKKYYLFFSLDDVEIEKKSIEKIYNNKNIVPIVSSEYSCKYSNILKSLCANNLLCKPSLYNDEQECYSFLLNRINNDEAMLYGEFTLYIPLILDLKKSVMSDSRFNPKELKDEQEDNRDISLDINNKENNENNLPENSIVEIEEETLDHDFIDNNIETDDILESDLEFLDEINQSENIQVNVDERLTKSLDISPIDNTDVKQADNIINKNENLPSENTNDVQIAEIIDGDQASDINDDNETEINSDEQDYENNYDVENETLNEISNLDDVISDITEKYADDEEIIDNEEETINQEKQNQEDENIEVPVKEKSAEEELLTEPVVSENINKRKPQDIKVYETDMPESLSVDNLPFKIGDKVFHPKHGNGIVEGFANYSNKILFCQIEFENVGRRILDPRIAGIEKVS